MQTDATTVVSARDVAAGSDSLTETERHRILWEWNDTRVEYPNVCVHELFEQQVERTPTSPAVVFERQQLTYRELNAHANQLAHYLQKRGVGPEVLVGVSLERSPEMLVALLGIWKAGGAYVPMDPTYPRERLDFMLRDSAARLLLTARKHSQLFPSVADQTVFIDSDWPLIAREGSNDSNSGATPANLAYVMYTSGSTGEPKGAMILQRGLVNYLCWAIRAYGVEAGGSVPVHSSISFDLTVTGLYPALLAGGKVELLPEDVGAQKLLAALRQGGNRNLVKLTPAHLELLSQQSAPHEAAGMTKVFVIGGENLLAESLKLWRDSAPKTRLINEYGPTETVVGCCVYEVKSGDPPHGPVPIGRPIANTQLYILDAEMNPVPPGVTRELYIGGAGVARGYLNRPELTEQKFVPDPFSGQKGARLYRTGDLARYRPDGTLEYLGRIDDQVKIRGYRIELGEIDASLAQHAVVQSCVVLAREDEPGDKQLVGYVVPRDSSSPSVDELRHFLRQRLPDYMVPAQFVFLDAFPLTHNGKVDRKALPAPGSGARETAQVTPSSNPFEDAYARLGNDSSDRQAFMGPQAGGARRFREFTSPRNETEKVLAGIWSELLKLENIGIHDDFFELGGHSLMAITLASRIRDRFKVELPLATLFQAPTIAALAELLHKEDWTSSWTSLVPIQTGGTRPPLFLIHAAEGNVLLYRSLVHHLGADQPVYGLQAAGLDGKSAIDPQFEHAASRYIKEIRSVQPKGPYLLGGYCLGGVIALEVAQQLLVAGEKIGLLAMIESFNVRSTRWPLPYHVRLLNRFLNLYYHLHNLVLAGRTGWTFFWEKARVEMMRAEVSTRVTLARVRRWLGVPSGYHHIKVADALDHAFAQYEVKPYPGELTVFLAQQHFLGMGDRLGGWESVPQAGLRFCSFPISPRGSLLEPYVQLVAGELRKCLDEAVERQSEQTSLGYLQSVSSGQEHTLRQGIIDRSDRVSIPSNPGRISATSKAA